MPNTQQVFRSFNELARWSRAQAATRTVADRAPHRLSPPKQPVLTSHERMMRHRFRD